MILVAIVLSFIQVAIADPCAFVAHQPIPIAQAIECFQTIPFSEIERDRTIDTLLKTIPFYVFVDAAQISPWNVNLQQSLTQISTENYKTDMEFQSALFGLFNSLQDAHTQYRVPACYYLPTIAYGVPFLGMYSAVVDGEQKVWLVIANRVDFFGKPVNQHA